MFTIVISSNNTPGFIFSSAIILRRLFTFYGVHYIFVFVKIQLPIFEKQGYKLNLLAKYT